MSQRRRIEERPLPRAPRARHISLASQDTTASGIAGSTISYGTLATGESLRLSQFPNPPSGLPLSPIQSEFGVPSPSNSNFSIASHRKEAIVGSAGTPQTFTSNGNEPAGSPILSQSDRHPQTAINDIQRRDSPLHPPSSRALSPYDWLEGASSIDIDTTEDRLLSTSFITSLLQENPSLALRRVQPISTASDRLSGYSEMTYPPSSRALSPDRYFPQSVAPLMKIPASRRHDRRPPPSAFVPVSDTPRLTSDDSDTLYSNQDQSYMSTIGNANLTPGLSAQEARVIGVTPATTRNISAHGGAQTIHKEKVSTATFSQRHSNVESAEGVDDNELDMPDSIAGPSLPHSPMSPSITRTQPRISQNISRTRQRQSVHSTKSYVSSLVSRLSSGTKSGRSIRHVMHWLRVKPLPPVPTLPHTPTTPEPQHWEAEECMPLSHPHQSLNTHDGLTTAFEELEKWHTIGRESARDRKPLRGGPPQESWTFAPDSPKTKGKEKTFPRKTKRIIVAVSLFVAAIIATSIAVAVTMSRKRRHFNVCTGNFTGASCDLNATCICTSSLSGQCDKLAQNLVDLTPTLNQLFHTNLTLNSLSNALWTVQGAPTGANCGLQSVLVDVAPALDSNKFQNRTRWAQSALLWNLVQSQDLATVAKMQKFILDAAWSRLGDSDGPVSDSSSAFSIIASGFMFDFASQTVSQPNVSFASYGQPTSSQMAQVGPIALSVLDRMYSFALASSTQRQQAMSTYWHAVLQQKPEDLPAFMTAFSSSPILIPFDATFSQGTQSLATLLTNSSISPFPPPLACYPGLSVTQVQRVNAIESSTFGLSPMSSPTQFDPSCYPDRPLYGVLDVLRLRLPFIDSRSDIARQAAVLKPDVAPRAVTYSGEILSPLPGLVNPPDITVTQTDPRQYGTLNHFNHVALNYLSAIPDVNVAIALVEFVLSSQTVPPPNSSILLESLASIPTLEVAIFGSIVPSDISSTVSSFSTPSDSIFFGSNQAAAFRHWTITGIETSIAWTEFAISPLVVHDSSYTDSTFIQAWNVASALPHNETGVDVRNITTFFTVAGEFRP